MDDRHGGEASINLPGACLSPSYLRHLSEKRLRRRQRLPWVKTRQVGEELLFVPYYFFRFINPRLRNRFYIYDVLVDGVLGLCEFIRGSFGLRQHAVSGELVLEKAISEEEAQSRAKSAVESFVLRRQSLWVKEIEVD